MAGLGPRAVLAAVAVGSQYYWPCLTCSCTCSLMIVYTTAYMYLLCSRQERQAARARAGAAAPGPNTAWSFLASLSWRFQGAAGFNSASLSPPLASLYRTSRSGTRLKLSSSQASMQGSKQNQALATSGDARRRITIAASPEREESAPSQPELGTTSRVHNA